MLNEKNKLYTPSFGRHLQTLSKMKVIASAHADIAVNDVAVEESKLAEEVEKEADSRRVKPVSRKEDDTTHSIHRIGGVYSRKVGPRLGAGSYGRAYLHVDGGDGQVSPHYYVVKVVSIYRKKISWINANGKVRERYHNPIEASRIKGHITAEIEVLQKLDRLIRFDTRVNAQGTEKHYIVQTHVPGITLFAYLENLKENQKKFTFTQAKSLMLGILNKLDALHTLNIAHGDFTTSNVMVNPQQSGYDVNIIDFGFSRTIGQPCDMSDALRKYRDNTGKYEAFPPECRYSNIVHFNRSTDVYALGDIFRRILRQTSHANQQEIDALIHYVKYRMRNHTPDRRPTLEAVKERLDRNLVEMDQNLKQSTINILNTYYHYHSLRTWAVLDRRKKCDSIEKVVKKLQEVKDHTLFVELLQYGLEDYLKKHVMNSLPHYLSLANLGRGVDVFVRALKLHQDEFNAELFVQGLKKRLEDKYRNQALGIETLCGRLVAQFNTSSPEVGKKVRRSSSPS